MTKKLNFDDLHGVWRTIGGRRVFIRTNQSLSEAMKESGKFKTKNKRTTKQVNEEYEELSKKMQQDDYYYKVGDDKKLKELRAEYNKLVAEGQEDINYKEYLKNYNYEKNMPEGAKFNKMLEESGVRTFADDIKEKETGYETYLRDRYGTTNEKLISVGNKSEKDLYQEYKNEVIRNINKKRMEKGTTSLNQAYKKAFEEYKKLHPNTKLNLKEFIKMSEE